jgi:ergothioneine biosynthesis protein EgtB
MNSPQLLTAHASPKVTRSAGTMAALAIRFSLVRRQTENLIKPLSAEDCQIQSMPDASPAKWHLAHLTWFFETFVLERFEAGFKPFDASFRVLFNSYYNGVGDKHPRPQRGLISRPSLSEVLEYRSQVDRRMLQTMEHVAARDSGLEQKEVLELVTLGLHHEQQHQELLLTDIKHALSLNPAQPAYARRWPLTLTRPQPLAWLDYDGGLIEHGFDTARDGEFCFDNESPRHRVYVAPFQLAGRLVTNGEMLAFIKDDGYQRPELWLSMGWDWVQAGQHRAPLYWQQQGGENSRRYQNFTLQGLVDVDLNTPVCHLSYFEADAFARWSGARLPTEFEWEFAATSISATSQANGNFVEHAAFHPLPQQGDGEGALVQMFGDVWEWTQSNYNPYPGYRPSEGLVGEYNGKFMCNQFVLRGGSCVTPKSHIRASYRNFFPPDARWQFSGLRLARDIN